VASDTIVSVRRFLVPFLAVGLVAGCGSGASEEDLVGSGRVPASADELPYGLVRCDPDAPRATGDDDLYRDEPVYVGNEQPVEEVRAWAATQPGYVEIWIDRDRNGWITVAFSEDADERQAELAERFPGVGVVAVGVDWTMAELEELRAELQEVGTVQTANVDPTRGRVEAWVSVLDDEHLGPLAEHAGDRLCVDGADPADAVPDGPQPTGGDGWRLLADEPTGEPYRTGIATTEDQYASLWEESAATAERPPVDFEAEVVIWFGAVYGSGCPIRMDEVIIDDEAALVYADIVVPGNPQACTSDANPRAFIIALARDRLPEGPFRLQLDANDPPAGAPEERTVVDVDLSAPGAIASDDEIGPDPDLVASSEDGTPRIEPGGTMEVGYPARMVLDAACDLTVVGPINGVHFAADEPVTPLPPEWQDAVTDDGTLEVEVLLEAAPARLTLNSAGRSVAYSPTDASTRPCP
jgi:hypothetical protein